MWGRKLKNVVVPQLTAPYLKFQIKQKYAPVIFLNQDLRIVTIDKDIEGNMPASHYAKIKPVLESMADGDICSIGGRIYVKTNKWTRDTVFLPYLVMFSRKN